MVRAGAGHPPSASLKLLQSESVDFRYDLQVVLIAVRGSGGLVERFFFVGMVTEPPAAWSAAKDVAVLEEAIEHGGDRGRIAEQLAPVLHGTIGSHQRAGPLMTTHDDLEEVLGGGGRELAHSEIVDDEQRHAL